MKADNSEQNATSEPPKLPRKLEEAIATLLGSPTLEAAAEALKVNPVTLRRWLKNPDFMAAYRQARRAVVLHAVANLQGATCEAVDTLRVVMKDANAPAGTRVAASKAVLDIAVKAAQLEQTTAKVEDMEACYGKSPWETTEWG